MFLFAVVAACFVTVKLALSPSRKFAYYSDTTFFRTQQFTYLFSVLPCANNTKHATFYLNYSSGMTSYDTVIHNVSDYLTNPLFISQNGGQPQGVSADCSIFYTTTSPVTIFRLDVGTGQYTSSYP